MTTPLASVSTKQVLQWIGSHLLRYKARVVGAVIALFTAAVAWLLLGQGIKYAIDSGFIENAADTLNKASISASHYYRGLFSNICALLLNDLAWRAG